LLIAAILGLVSLIITLISLITFAIMRLLGSSAADEPSVQFDFSQPAPPIDPGLVTSPSPNLFIGAIFWIVVIGATIAALVFFVQSREIDKESWPIRQTWQKILAWLQSLWYLLVDQAEGITQAVRSRLPVTGHGALTRPPGWRFFRIGSLSPREKIWYFYLSLIRRAAASGVERAGNETPLEYKQDLLESWPEAETDLETLTDAFLEARYSRHPVNSEEVDPVKIIWKRLRSIFRQKRK
jgi:hypothetical protein